MIKFKGGRARQHGKGLENEYQTSVNCKFSQQLRMTQGRAAGQRTMPWVFLPLLELPMALWPPLTPTVSHTEQPWLSNMLIIRAYQAKREGKVSAKRKVLSGPFVQQES